MVACLVGCRGEPEKPLYDLGRFSAGELTQRIVDARELAGQGDRIEALSSTFLDVPYQGHRLVGSATVAEQLTINLSGLDCFTYLDYVETMRRSVGWDDFRDELRQVRYKRGEVSWQNRRHFFSDWVAAGDGRVVDRTQEVGGARARVAAKQLNRKADGGRWLDDIPVVPRRVAYIPSSMLDAAVLAKIRSGDYIGIFTPQAGLDVSHNGIAIWEQRSAGGTSGLEAQAGLATKAVAAAEGVVQPPTNEETRTGQRLLFRHASSRASTGKVVEEDFVAYVRKRPGIVVYRAIEVSET